MDTSEVYVKMCDHPKVQEQEPYVGDTSKDYHHWGGEKGDWELCVWLPKQDQVQALLEIKCVGSFYFYVYNMFFCSEGGAHYNADPLWRVTDRERFKTPEQLWVAYYMYNKHDMLWNGEEWETGAKDKDDKDE